MPYACREHPTQFSIYILFNFPLNCDYVSIELLCMNSKSTAIAHDESEKSSKKIEE